MTTPAGDTLATAGSSDGLAKLWTTKTRQQLPADQAGRLVADLRIGRLPTKWETATTFIGAAAAVLERGKRPRRASHSLVPVARASKGRGIGGAPAASLHTVSHSLGPASPDVRRMSGRPLRKDASSLRPPAPHAMLANAEAATWRSSIPAPDLTVRR
jgi:hypothetical protein